MMKNTRKKGNHRPPVRFPGGSQTGIWYKKLHAVYIYAQLRGCPEGFLPGTRPGARFYIRGFSKTAGLLINRSSLVYCSEPWEWSVAE
jgi:hypothetical protein